MGGSLPSAERSKVQTARAVVSAFSCFASCADAFAKSCSTTGCTSGVGQAEQDTCVG